MYKFAAIIGLLILVVSGVLAQSAERGQNVRTVSIPISIFTKQEIRELQLSEYVQTNRLIVREKNEEQTILSIRSIEDTPLSIAVLIQDDLTSGFNLQIKDIANFIRTLPKGTRVMVAYLRGGTLEVRHRFSSDLEAAARSLRIVTSNPATAPRSPFDSLTDALDRFDALPSGRRCVLFFSDGLDLSRGGRPTPGDSIDLDRAILRAQRRSVSVYPMYWQASQTEGGAGQLSLTGQGSLQKLADETGGRAFFQGTGSPVSVFPFIRELRVLLNRQFLLTYLSTHMKRGFYKVDVSSTNPQVKIEHPHGYYYR